MFANGISLGEDTSTATWTDSDNIHIGAQDSGGPFFNGQIDDVKIYNYSRTSAQIAWDYNRGKPVAQWSFNEGQGTTVHNEIENLNHGTITGATWRNESECKSGKCLWFDGLDTTRVDMDTEDNMSNFTACAWVKASALTNPDNESQMMIFNKGFGLTINNSGNVIFERFTSAAYPIITTTEGINANEWYRICGVYSGVSIAPKIYINGINMVGTSYSGSGLETDDSARPLRMGSVYSNEYSSNFYGYIDDPKIYNYALTAEQIKEDYSEGAVNFK